MGSFKANVKLMLPNNWLFWKKNLPLINIDLILDKHS